MATYTLYATNTVSTVVGIEADSLEEAIDEAYIQGFPGLMFLDHTYPDVGDWEIDEEQAREDYPEGEDE